MNFQILRLISVLPPGYDAGAVLPAVAKQGILPSKHNLRLRRCLRDINESTDLM